MTSNKYRVEYNGGNTYVIFENDYPIYTQKTEKAAYAMLFRLNRGSGFEGETPIFFRENA